MDLSGLSAGGRLFAVAAFIAVMVGLYFGLTWLVPRTPMPLLIVAAGFLVCAFAVNELRMRWQRQALESEGFVEHEPALTKRQRVLRRVTRAYWIVMSTFCAAIAVAAISASITG